MQDKIFQRFLYQEGKEVTVPFVVKNNRTTN